MDPTRRTVPFLPANAAAAQRQRAASSSAAASSSPSSCLSPSLTNTELRSYCLVNRNKRPAGAALPPAVTEHDAGRGATTPLSSTLSSSFGSSSLPGAVVVVKRPRLCQENLLVDSELLRDPSMSAISAANAHWPGSAVSSMGALAGISGSCAVGGVSSSHPRGPRPAEGATQYDGDCDVSFHGEDHEDAQPERDSYDTPSPPSTPLQPSYPVRDKGRGPSSQWLFQSHDGRGHDNPCRTGRPNNGSTTSSGSSLLESRATHHPIRLFERSPGSSPSSSTAGSGSARSGSANNGSEAPSSSAPYPSVSTAAAPRLWRYQSSTVSSSQSLLSTQTNAGDSVRALADEGGETSSNSDDEDEEGNDDSSFPVGRTLRRSLLAADDNANTCVAAATGGSTFLSLAGEDAMEGVVATIDALTESVQSWSLVKVRNGSSHPFATSGGDGENACQHRQARRQVTQSAKKRVMRVLLSSASTSSSLQSTSSSAPPPPPPPQHRNLSVPLSASSLGDHRSRRRRESSSPLSSSSTTTTTGSHHSISSFFSVASSTRMLEG